MLGKERLEHILHQVYPNLIPVRNGKSPLLTIIHVYEIIFTYTYAHISEKAMASHSSTLAWKIPMDRGAWRATAHGVAKIRTQLSN